MDQRWINELWNKVEKKLSQVVPSVETIFPYTTDEKGKYIPVMKDGQLNIHWWTNGFWGGMMWLAWQESKKEIYRQKALESEKALESLFLDFQNLTHDVGFLWLSTAVTHYKLDGSLKAKDSGLHAATVLAGRFNVQGEFIRAWNASRLTGWTIIDSMMNIPILYWATEETGDPRFWMIAEKHANTIAKHFIRDDGSVNHVVAFEPETGEVVDTPAGQGYAPGSSWSRGQAWAIYGFMLSYIHTGNQKYMDIAKRVAHYFISNLPEDGVPRIDFRAPKEPVLFDTTAGAIAACGIIEIMKHVDEYEKDIYENAVEKLMKGLEANCDFTMNRQSILQNCSQSYHNEKERHISIIYGDYYLMEAILKMKDLGESK